CNQSVTLATDVTVTGRNVECGSTVQSPVPRSLLVNASGATTFGGAVGGGDQPLLSVETNTPGTTLINGGAVTTTTTQTYRDPVTLGAKCRSRRRRGSTLGRLSCTASRSTR